jgi:hypothetical protein
MNAHTLTARVTVPLVLFLGASSLKAATDALSVTIGKPWTISSDPTGEDTHFHPALFQLCDGTLLLDYQIDGFVEYPRRRCLRSVDKGKTWKRDPPRANTETALGQLKDGTVLGYNMYTKEVAPGSTEARGELFRSTDGGKTFQGPLETTVRLRLVLASQPQHSMSFWRSILEIPNGDLVACMHGRYKGDPKVSAACVRSKDRGLTWDYLSDLGRGDASATGMDGFCEPVLCFTKAGDILCMMRTGGNAGQPMAQVRSADYGESWSTPQSVGVDSKDPDLCLLGNGVLACSFGQPGCWIMFDATGTGREWGKPIQVFGGLSFCYTGIREIEPGKLLYVYDAPGFDDGSGHGRANCLRAVEIRVERAGPQ